MYVTKSVEEMDHVPVPLQSFFPKTLAEFDYQVSAFLTAPATAAEVPGVTPAILAAAAEGSKWGYTYAFR